MTIYIFLNLAILFLALIFSSNKKKYIGVVFLLLIFIFGLRGNFTQDYNSYALHFNYIDESISFKDIFHRSFSMENGFVFLEKIIGVFTDSYVVYHFVLSIILLSFYFSGLKKSLIPWLAIFIFVNMGDFYGAMNLYRQALAGAILFAYSGLLINKKYKSYILVVLITSTIHTTALVMIPLSLFLTMKVSLKNSLIYAVITTILYVSLDMVIDLITSFFSKYENYWYGMSGGSINAVVAILALCIFVVYSLNFEVCDFNINSTENRILINGTILCLIFMILGVNTYMMTRFVYFFRPFACVLVADVLAKYKSEKNKLIFTMVIVILSMLYTAVTLSGTAYVPYYFFWEAKV